MNNNTFTYYIVTRWIHAMVQRFTTINNVTLFAHMGESEADPNWYFSTYNISTGTTTIGKMDRIGIIDESVTAVHFKDGKIVSYKDLKTYNFFENTTDEIDQALTMMVLFFHVREMIMGWEESRRLEEDIELQQSAMWPAAFSIVDYLGHEQSLAE